MVTKEGINLNGRLYKGDELLAHIGQSVWVRQGVIESDLIVHGQDGNYIGMATNKELCDNMIQGVTG